MNGRDDMVPCRTFEGAAEGEAERRFDREMANEPDPLVRALMGRDRPQIIAAKAIIDRSNRINREREVGRRRRRSPAGLH